MTYSKMYRWFNRPQNLNELVDKGRRKGVAEFNITPWGYGGVPGLEGLQYLAELLIVGSRREVKYTHTFGISKGINPFMPREYIDALNEEEIRELKEATLNEAQTVSDKLRIQGFNTRIGDFVLNVPRRFYGRKYYSVIFSDEGISFRSISRNLIPI